MSNGTSVTASVIETIIKSIILLLVMTGGFAYLTLYERKVLARIQVRVGPNRAGPWGILQPIADAVKLLSKQLIVPAGVDRTLFRLSPLVVMAPALIGLAVVPFSQSLNALNLGLISDSRYPR